MALIPHCIINKNNDGSIIADGRAVQEGVICSYLFSCFSATMSIRNAFKYASAAGGGSASRRVFVAATAQHVGKTSACLGIVKGLQKIFDGKVGYVKPVGQKSVTVKAEPAHDDSFSDSRTAKTFRVDKDVPPFKTLLNCRGHYEDMSPLLFGRGYTREFLDGRINHREQLNKIETAAQRLSAQSEFLVAEGTGHVGVGSLCGLNNALVADVLGTGIVLVVNGGIGSAFDELSLNKALCDAEGAAIMGVLMNKVDPEKIDEVRHYANKALQRWFVPLIGCVPDLPSLESPAVLDFEKCGMRLIAGHEYRQRHFGSMELVITSVSRFIEDSTLDDSTLYFMHSSRTDLILAFLHAVHRHEKDRGAFPGGLVLVGDREEDEALSQVSSFLGDANLPVLYASGTVIDVLTDMQKYTAKLNVDDPSRALAVVDHYERHIDFETLMGAL